jgi:hypothetical protein
MRSHSGVVRWNQQRSRVPPEQQRRTSQRKHRDPTRHRRLPYRQPHTDAAVMSAIKRLLASKKLELAEKVRHPFRTPTLVRAESNHP